MSATEYRYGYEAGQAGGTRPPNASTDWYRGYDAASATGEMVTYRDVHGKVSEGRKISVHPMTGEIEVMTSKGVAYVSRDRILPTNVTEQPKAGTLSERTAALQEILQGITRDTGIVTTLDHAHTTEARVTMLATDQHTLSITLKPSTTDLHFKSDRPLNGHADGQQWADVLTALNLTHRWINAHRN